MRIAIGRRREQDLCMCARFSSAAGAFLEERLEWQPPDTTQPGEPVEFPDPQPEQPGAIPDEVPSEPREVPQPGPPETGLGRSSGGARSP